MKQSDYVVNVLSVTVCVTLVMSFVDYGYFVPSVTVEVSHCDIACCLEEPFIACLVIIFEVMSIDFEVFDCICNFKFSAVLFEAVDVQMELPRINVIAEDCNFFSG